MGAYNGAVALGEAALDDPIGLASNMAKAAGEQLSSSEGIGNVVGGAVFEAALGAGIAKGLTKLDDLKVLTKLDDTPDAAPPTRQLADATGDACFVAGILVLTDDGSKPIEEIEVGDLVWSFNVETGEFELKEVVETFVHEYEGDFTVIVVDGQEIEATGNHPFLVLEGQGLESRPLVEELPFFWVGDSARWVEARHLVIGDLVLLGDGRTATVDAVAHYEGKALVYNFHVTDNHSYLVSASGVVVHNDCTPGGGTYTPDRQLPRTKHGDPIPDADTPHSQLGKNRDGEPAAREWVDDGNGGITANRDIEFTDHGTPEIHPNPHQHQLTPNNPDTAPRGGYKRGKAEDLEYP